MIVCLVEIPGRCGGQLLLGVEQLEIHIDCENGIEGLFGGAGSGPYLVDWSSFVVHAEGVVVGSVNAVKGEI